MTHRGPDEEGRLQTPEVTLGVRRLAIVDVLAGHQPTSSEDGSITAVMNGELYNHVALREFLVKRGHSFRSGTDTEVLPHLYEELGGNLTSVLRGMFAIAIWDQPSHRLLLARDRIGEKPLLYARTVNGIAFASELKSLLCHPDVSPTIDPLSVAMYLTLDYVPGPRTMLRGINKLPPGCCLSFEGGHCRIDKYWDVVPSMPRGQMSFKRAPRELRMHLRDSVAGQLQADRPVGILLSGGIDSAAIAAVAADLSDRPPRTFTVGYEEGETDERAAGRRVARALGTVHTELVMRPPSFEELARMVWYLDEPVADQAAIATYMIAKEASKHVTVVLTGEGADELFAGYPRYRWFSRAERIQRAFRTPALPGSMLPVALLAQRRGLGRQLDLLFRPRNWLDRHFAWISTFDDASRRALEAGTSELDPIAELTAHYAALVEDAGFTGTSPTERLMLIDLNSWLPDDVLVKADRMTMAASLEARAPYLDHRIVEFASSLPLEVRLAGHQSKWLLREAVRDLLPPAVLRRPKRAFLVPADFWLKESLREHFSDLLLSGDSVTSSLFSRSYISELIRDRVGSGTHKVWSLAVLELWMRTHRVR